VYSKIQNKKVIVNVPLKGKQFSGMKTTMLNYVKDLDYMGTNDNTKASLLMNTDQMHNYSVNYNKKSGKKKALLLTTQKGSKRRSVDRDHSKPKHKRSASDENRILSSKRRKKEHTKSPSTHSAYYNKMISAFSNNSKYPTKNIRKIYNHNGNIIRKKGGKEIGSKKNC